MTKFIRLPKPADPLAAEIQARLATKRRSSKREHTTESYEAPKRFKAVAEALRVQTISFDMERV